VRLSACASCAVAHRRWWALDEILQAIERLIPLHRDRLEMPARVSQALLLQPPDALAAALRTADQTGSLHHAQVLRDRLARHGEAGGEPRNRHRSGVAKAGDEAQSRLVA